MRNQPESKSRLIDQSAWRNRQAGELLSALGIRQSGLVGFAAQLATLEWLQRGRRKWVPSKARRQGFRARFP